MKKDLTTQFHHLIELLQDAKRYRELGLDPSCLDAIHECNKLLEDITHEARKNVN